MDDLVNVRMLDRDILEKTYPKNFQFHISVGTELRVLLRTELPAEDTQ